jgi:hypothetical protein
MRSGIALVACEAQPASSCRVRSTPAQQGKRRVGATPAQHSRELDRVVHGDPAQLRVRHRPGVCAQAKDRCVLTGERLRECGAVREVPMQNLLQLGVRVAELPAPERRHTFNGGVLECVAKSVATDHSRRAHDDQALRARRRNVGSRLRDAAWAVLGIA